MLPSTIAPEYAMTAYGEATAMNGLTVATFWRPLALVLTIAYALVVVRHYNAAAAGDARP